MEAITSLGGTALQARLWDARPGRAARHAGRPRAARRAAAARGDLPRQELAARVHALPEALLPAARRTRHRDQLWGYNHQSLAWLTGPGYFVVHQEGDAPAAIDYRLVPPSHPPSWPAVKPNDVGFSRFVYRDMVDYLRRVSRHVLIGRATRYGKELPNYFLLCREP